MILSKVIFFIFLMTPSLANNPDEQIINNLEFFQNMELLKEDSSITYGDNEKIILNDSKAGNKTELEKNNEAD